MRPLLRLFTGHLLMISLTLSSCVARGTHSAEPPDISGNAKKFQRFDGFPYEPSDVVQLPDGRFLIVEDEKKHPLDILSIQPGRGISVKALFPKKQFKKDSKYAAFRKLSDLEGAATDKRGFVYVITSHSRKKSGKEKPNRSKFARFKVDGDQIRDPRVITDLKKHLSEQYPFLAEAAAIQTAKRGGIVVEAMTFDPKTGHLLLGFRSPLSHGTHGRALLLAIKNVDAMFESGETPLFSKTVTKLDLKGDGIRGMTYDPHLQGFLIIGGPLTLDFKCRLWFWRGRPFESVRPVAIRNLKDLRQAEGIVPIQVNGRKRLLIVSDDGDVDEEESGHYLLLNYDRLVMGP